MEIKPEQLRKKGWTEKEINHAKSILKKAKGHKHPHNNLLNEGLFWGILGLSIFAMVAITYWITPLFMYSKTAILIPIIILIGVAFGFLFRIIIKDLDHFKVHHHTLLIIAIPVAGILSSIAIFGSVIKSGVITQNNPYITSIIFILSFLAPYIHHLSNKKK